VVSEEVLGGGGEVQAVLVGLEWNVEMRRGEGRWNGRKDGRGHWHGWLDKLHSRSSGNDTILVYE
jgi:hypothetical protein